MSGTDLMNNLIDELNRARDFLQTHIKENPTETLTDEETLFEDIRRDLDRYYDYADSFDAVLDDIEIEE